MIATGHNLDDEAARLLGNVLHWQTEYLARQKPVIQPRHEKFVRKVKPLYLTSEFETATYSFMKRIDYVVEECPNAVGASQLDYKAVLDRLENTSPGTKVGFVRDFVVRGSRAFEQPAAERQADGGGTCTGCGMPSYGTLCSFCSLRAEVDRKLALRVTPAPPSAVTE